MLWISETFILCYCEYFEWNRCGGGSLVYANTLYIPPEEFFNNMSWQRFGDWKKILEPFFYRASFMLGRKKYSKLNTEDKFLEEVSKEMNAHSTFETVHVRVI
jgi:cholesterol oxidase